jgi:hypothetical protein
MSKYTYLGARMSRKLGFQISRKVSFMERNLFILDDVTYGFSNIYEYNISDSSIRKVVCLLGLPTKARIPIVFRFIIEYSNLRDFGP